MPEAEDSTPAILQRCRQTLRLARMGAQAVESGSAEEVDAGLCNVMVWGRAVTNVLQNLRSTEQSYDEWYKPIVDEMRADPLLRFCYEWRTPILKEGRHPSVMNAGAHIRHLNSAEIMRRFPPPAGVNVKGFFVGDPQGGSGWLIVLPNGTEEKYYVCLPADMGMVSVVMSDAPMIHLGQPISDRSPTTYCRVYLDYFERLIDAAEKRFLPGTAAG